MMQKLKEISSPFLDEQLDFGEMKKSVEHWYDHLLQISGVDMDDMNESEDTFTSFGQAVSPVLAAFCLTDFMRTIKFVRSTHKAINDQLKAGAETVEVLYAGTGPYAPMFTAVAPHFDPSQVKFTLLDIHQQSVDSVQAIINSANLQPYVRKLICTDAITYQCEVAPNIILSETMKTGLHEEPQVAITLNLYPQMASNGVFIPENICLDLVYRDKKETEDPLGAANYEKVDRVFDLVECINSQPDWKDQASTVLSEQLVELPQNRRELEIWTWVKIYGNIDLGPRESALTLPRPFRIAPGTRQLKFNYLLDKTPRLIWESS